MVVRSLARSTAQAVGLPLALLCVWQLVIEFGIVLAVLLPSPIEVLGRASVRVFADAEIYRAVIASLRRIGQGWLLAAGVGVGIGLVAGLSRRARLVLEGPMNACRSLPPASLVPLAILWLGIGDAASVALVAFIAVWPVLINTIAGIENVPRVQQEAALTMGATTAQLIVTVLIPWSLASIVVGLRLAMGLAWMGVVLSELVGVRHGLGALLLVLAQNGDVAAMLLIVCLIGVLGLLLDWAFRSITRPLMRWQQGVLLS